MVSSSYLYFFGIGICFLVLVWHCHLTSKAHDWNAQRALVVFGMALVFAFEFRRELIIYLSGVVPELTYLRAVILRMEHTWFGCYLCEVITNATQNFKRHQ